MSKNGTWIERELLISTLRLTRNGSVSRGLLSREARVPTQIADDKLKKFSNAGLFKLGDETIEASSDQRLKLAVQALKLGADFERVCKFLEWIEFENISAVTFEANAFTVMRRFRFKWAGRRWEIDLLGLGEPMIVCADCKHWLRGWRRSAIIRAVEPQVVRTKALADALPSLYNKIGLTNWKHATLIPMVLSLVPSPFKFHNLVPIVPILQLQSFLNELPAHTTTLKHFTINLRNN